MGAEDFIILIKDVSSQAEYFCSRFQKCYWYTLADMTGFATDKMESIVQSVSFFSG